MFCYKCGYQLPEDAAFCPSCGAQQESQAATNNAPQQTEPTSTYSAPQPSAPQPPAQPYSYGSTQPTAQPDPYATAQQTAQYGHYNNVQTVERPMKWYKFLIYFSLFAGAVLNVINAISYLTGSVYISQGFDISDINYLYTVYHGLQTADIIYSIVLIGLAVLGFVARFQLAKYKAKGPILLYALSAGSMAVSLIYSIATYSILSVDIGAEIAPLISNLVTQTVMLVLNYVYFNKRKDMFVN